MRRTELPLQKGAWRNLFIPCWYWGAAKRGRGKESNTPPPAFHVRLPGGTREAFRGMPRHVERRKGETPDAMPMSRRGGGWGGGVCMWESHGHQDADGRRRPRACRKVGAK